MRLNKTFSQLRQPIYLIIAAMLTAIFFSRCSDEPSNIGSELLPDNISGTVYDTVLPVELLTIEGNRLRENIADDKSLLGSVKQESTGTFNASFITNFIYTEEPAFKSITDANNIELVSFKLLLVFNNVIGNLDELQFEIYELYDPIPVYDSSNYVILNHMINTDTILAEVDGILEDSEEDDDDSDTAYINLSLDFAQKLLAKANIDRGIYNSANYEDFQNVFNGLYFKAISPTNVGGGVIEVDHEQSLLELVTTITYSVDSTVTTTTNFHLGFSTSEIDEGGNHLNIFNHSLSAGVQNAIGNTSVTDYAYLIAPAGTRVLVSIPDLPYFRDDNFGKISINRAELILPYTSSINKGSIPLASKLGLHDSGTRSTIADNAVEDYLNGNLVTSTQRYLLNIGNHLHAYMANESNTVSETFNLFIADSISDLAKEGDDFEYVILNGSSAEDYPYLRVVYSQIP